MSVGSVGKLNERGESLYMCAQAKFLGCADVAFSIPELQSDPPDGLSQELPWLQIRHEAIVSSSFCQLCLSMLSERAVYSFLPWMPKSQSPCSRPRYEA